MMLQNAESAKDGPFSLQMIRQRDHGRRGCRVRDLQTLHWKAGSMTLLALFSGESRTPKESEGLAAQGCVGQGRVAAWRLEPSRSLKR